MAARPVAVKRRLARRLTAGVTLLLVSALAAAEPAPDYAELRRQVDRLGELVSEPATYPAGGFVSGESIRPLFYAGPAWQGRPTRVFAWLGLPASTGGKVPGVVLVHGGGGTAYKEWVRKWNEQGFAAIAMGLEGQTDEPHPQATREARWQRHPWGGPPRDGIYGDSGEPLSDQWMYHAVANVVLAHSLLRAQPEVDPARIGVCGISWGGIITSTVVGIDSRFAFGIPIYGCGALDRAPNHYRQALEGQGFYQEVWEPLLRLHRATLPMLWLTGPRDAHFPLEIQQASYRAASGPRMVAVPFDMKHSHPAGWSPPDSYAFARAIVDTGRTWARELAQEVRDGRASVTFAVTRPVNRAMLVYRRDADWEQAPARLEVRAKGEIQIDASLPAGTTSWYFNAEADGLTLSSELRAASPDIGATRTTLFPGFSWDRVPLALHFGKRDAMTEAELDFAAQQSRFIVLEKGHGLARHGSTEEGIADTARQIKRRHPQSKVLFYFNAFVNWELYDAFQTYQPEWTLRNLEGDILRHPSGASRPDPSNPRYREWWLQVVLAQHRRAPMDGVFVDALPQALASALARQVGGEKARAIVAGLREMLALAKQQLGPERIILANGIRTTDFHEILDWEGIDGVMIEHFGAFHTSEPEDMKSDLDSFARAEKKGKFVVLKGWPGFSWLDEEMMKRPRAELLELARRHLTFPLACFLVAARPGSHFCYAWGYQSHHGGLDPYPEFERGLGPPRGDAIWTGFTAQREFEHASVWVDLVARDARIEWR